MAIAESLLAPSRARLCLTNSQARAPRRAAARRGPAKQPGGRSDAHRPPGHQAEAGQQEQAPMTGQPAVAVAVHDVRCPRFSGQGIQ